MTVRTLTRPNLENNFDRPYSKSSFDQPFSKRLYSDYLAENYINGALVVEYIFENVLTGAWKDNMAERSEYALNGLNLDQKIVLQINKIISRIEKVMNITRTLKLQYGVDHQKYIRDKEGFLKYLNADYKREGLSLEDIDIRLFRLSIGFYLPKENYYKKYGRSLGTTFPLDDDIDTFLKLNLPDPIQYVLIKDCDSGRTKNNKLATAAEIHEFKHIIDNLIGKEQNVVTSEMSALTYEYGHQLNHPNIEKEIFKYLRENYYVAQNTIKGLNIKGLGKKLELQNDEFILQNVYLYDYIKALKNKGLDLNLLSFIISMSDHYELPERLESINNFLS